MANDFKFTEDIICEESNDDYLNNILSKFVKQQNDYGNDVSKEQRNNIKKLTKILFCKHKENSTVIVPIPMGEGKSSLIVEFIKYMYWSDKTFGAIIVKKTIEECEDLCIAVGVSDKDNQYYSEKKSLKSAYYHGSGINEKDFIVKTVRGFNFKECTKFNTKNKNELNYDFSICNTCERKSSCKVYLSKSYAKNHRFIAITHQRLFLSNDDENIIEELMEFKDDNNCLVKRKLIIIDEKIDTIDIRSITSKGFHELRGLVQDYGTTNHKEQFKYIEEYIFNSLKYPESVKSNVIKQDRIFQENFKFDDELVKTILSKGNRAATFLNLMILEKILGTKNITTNRNYREKEIRIINFYRYINIENFCSRFEKSIILDATSIYEIDYFYSKKIIVNDINAKTYDLNLYYANINLSKSKLGQDLYNYINSIVQEITSISNTVKGRILIVCYKDLKKYLINKLNDKDSRIEIIHLGQYTTGTNKFNDYDNVIILGVLNKGDQYYQNKCLVLKVLGADDFSTESTASDNIVRKMAEKEFLIDSIQQIGRSALRMNRHVNVYMFNSYPDFVKELVDIFDIKLIEYEPKYLVAKENSYMKIKKLIFENCKNYDDRINKKEIRETLLIAESTYKKAVKVNNEDFENFKIQNKILEGTRFFVKVR